MESSNSNECRHGIPVLASCEPCRRVVGRPGGAVRRCGNGKCATSTGIDDRLTFGSGRLGDNGFWERPCAVCEAAYYERECERLTRERDEARKEAREAILAYGGNASVAVRECDRLRSALDAAESRERGMREAVRELDRHAYHYRDCAQGHDYSGACSCGLGAARDLVRSAMSSGAIGESINSQPALDAARAETERLRAALAGLVAACGGKQPTHTSHPCALCEALAIARAALDGRGGAE
jgi:hypothetical protein